MVAAEFAALLRIKYVRAEAPRLHTERASEKSGKLFTFAKRRAMQSMYLQPHVIHQNELHLIHTFQVEQTSLMVYYQRNNFNAK